MTIVRLQKFMADKWIASRRKSEEFILKWAVKVNGKIITEMWTKVDPEVDKVEVDWNFLKSEEEKLVYYVLNKPEWYIATTNKSDFEPDIVTDLVPKEIRVFPIWRLDKETTGLLLMTNDWDLTFKLTHPSFHHEKEYEVLTGKKIYDDQIKKIASWWMEFLWRKLQTPVKVWRRSSRSFWIILKEWMNRQIRRMVRNVWVRVEKLKRIRVENITLWDLEVGKYRELTKRELKILKEITSKVAENS